MREGKSISNGWIGVVMLATMGILCAHWVLAADPVQEAIESPAKVHYGRLKKGVENILSKEQTSLVQLEKEAGQLPKLEAIMDKAINNYKIRLSSDSNLLLLPGTRTEDLEKAWNEHRVNQPFQGNTTRVIW